MEQYPILAVDGEKLVKEDVDDGWKLAGTVGDKVLAQLAQVAVASGSRTGWVVPVEDGPIVVSDGATGKVKVKPFAMYRSPLTGETTRDLMSAFYAGSSESVPTPVPSSGNHRWDLLYAVISETDAVSESRLVEDPATEVISAQTINTRHRSQVTLAWVQGTVAATATDPYPAANWPALPAPASGQAHVPLAYVHVEYDATPATVNYTVHKIAPVAPVARINPQTGAVSTNGAGLAFINSSPVVANSIDAKTIATTTGANQWPRALGGNRPKAFIEQPNGQRSLWIHFDLVGASLVTAAWSIVPAPLFTPDAAHAAYSPIDWKNRWFMGRLALGRQGETFAHDFGGASAARLPTMVPSAGAMPFHCDGAGNTVASDDYFDAMGGAIVAGDWYVACYFADVLSSGAANDLAVVVRKSATAGIHTQGGMYLAVREVTANALDDRAGLIKLDCTGPFSALGL